jgi:hypothetical protein
MPTMVTMPTRIVKLGTQARATLAPAGGFGTYPKKRSDRLSLTVSMRK